MQEGYGHVELAKRYTTNGMATDQGKLSNVNAIGILAEARGVSPAEVGTTTFRPFYTPVSFGALTGASKGKHFQPVRKSPLHDWAAEEWRGLRRDRPLVSLVLVPARRRNDTGAKSVDREVLNVRAERRPLRRLDARQDRDLSARMRPNSSTGSTATPS